MNAASAFPTTEGMALREEIALRWETLANTSPAELNGRLLLVKALINGRLDTTDPDVLTVLRAAEGWSIEELAAGERRGPRASS